jgi:hypothetical protein
LEGASFARAFILWTATLTLGCKEGGEHTSDLVGEFAELGR